MRSDQLPTANEVLGSADAALDLAFAALNDAYRLFGDAADWLRSDWQPVGSGLTSEQAASRDAMREIIAAGKRAINGIKDEARR